MFVKSAYFWYGIKDSTPHPKIAKNIFHREIYVTPREDVRRPRIFSQKEVQLKYVFEEKTTTTRHGDESSTLAPTEMISPNQDSTATQDFMKVGTIQD